VTTLALLAAAVGIVRWLAPEAETAAEPRSGASSGPTLPPPPQRTYPPATPEAVAAAVEELGRFVEMERGLEFTEPVTVEVIDEETFRLRVLEDLTAQLPEIELAARVLGAAGLAAPGEDIVEGFTTLVSAAALGYYDPTTGELVVAGTEMTPLLESTIVHELTHALDDQWFDLDRPELADLDDESGFGFSAVVEGNATRVEETWVSTLDETTRQELFSLEVAIAQSAGLTGVPWIVGELVRAPYDAGYALVATLLALDGEVAVDRALEAPPTTSSEVLWPERYVAGFTARAVPTPPVDDPTTDVVFDEAVFGELLLRLTLWGAVGEIEAAEVARGWRGDRYVAWADAEGRDCIRLDTVTVNAEARQRLLDGLTSWAERLPDATAGALDADGVRFTSCVVPNQSAEAGSRL
jgi:hypothetical protein